ncbi:MAG: hypothetical protein WCD35_09010 [Mycobacteriales bacterium]
MTEMRHASTDYRAPAGPEPTGWVGWILFAGIMLFMVGTFQAIAGLVALFKDDYYLVATNKLVIDMNFTAWGWTHLIIGVLAVFAGWGVMVGQMWARIFGITLAFLSAVANLAFIGAYPVWGVIMITVDVLVIYALSVHGREVKALD